MHGSGFNRHISVIGSLIGVAETLNHRYFYGLIHVLVYSLCHAEISITVGYEVSVNILTNAPIVAWSMVPLTCSIDPVPPGQVSYQWSTSIPHTPYTFISSRGPSADVYIGPAPPRWGLYFCHVLSNGSEVAVGHTVIKPQGRKVAF